MRVLSGQLQLLGEIINDAFVDHCNSNVGKF